MKEKGWITVLADNGSVILQGNIWVFVCLMIDREGIPRQLRPERILIDNVEIPIPERVDDNTQARIGR